MLIPETIIHGTTNIGVKQIKQYGIQSRGFNLFGKSKLSSSLDFGEGFYCTYNNIVCREQALQLARTRASIVPTATPRLIEINIDLNINQDRSLKGVYFDGNKQKDGLEWANFIVHHRVLKNLSECTRHICNGHPDIMIGPVADGNAITAYAIDVYNGKMKLEDFYHEITQATWFPNYKQIVFGKRAIKYLKPVL